MRFLNTCLVQWLLQLVVHPFNNEYNSKKTTINTQSLITQFGEFNFYVWGITWNACLILDWFQRKRYIESQRTRRTSRIYNYNLANQDELLLWRTGLRSPDHSYRGSLNYSRLASNPCEWTTSNQQQIDDSLDVGIFYISIQE